MRKSRKYLILTAGLTVFVMAGLAFFRLKEKLMPAPLPPVRTYNAASISQTNNSTPAASDSPLPAEVNLQIPFASQAPHQNWDAPYQQFCEEASLLMAASYVKGEAIPDPDDADAKMLAIKDFEEKRFGSYEDTNAEETAVILREYYNLEKVEVVPDPTVQNIKAALAKGRAVIVPLAGRQLDNPYFRQPGPVYHMLVAKGYEKNGDFITNDPGTKRGANFIYAPDNLMNAIHDWNEGNVDAGRKVMIIVG